MSNDHHDKNDAKWKAEARKRQTALQKEWDSWGGNALVTDRIVLAAWVPSIKKGNRKEFEQVANCLLEQIKGGRASKSALRTLTSLSLRQCLEREFQPTHSLIEVAALLLEQRKPKHKRRLPEERQRVIKYIVGHAGRPLPGRRKIGAATAVSDSTIRKWFGDAHFVQEVNELAGRKNAFGSIIEGNYLWLTRPII